MKLIPLTIVHTRKPKHRLKKSIDLQMKRMIMNKFMRPLRYLLSCLDRNPKDTTHYNQVLNENIQYAFKGSFPDAWIDYTRLIVSKGELPATPEMTVSSSRPGQLIFKWRDNSGGRGALESDYLLVALFNRASQKWLFEIDAAERSDCQLEMEPNGFHGKRVHIYAGFVSVDSYRISRSVYLGEVQVMRAISHFRA